MAIQLSQFDVAGLHGRRSVRLRIADNRLILVGENGTGKTTVISILYYFLSRQWGRLAQYDFTTITAVINGRRISLHREWLSDPALLHDPRRAGRHIPSRYYEYLRDILHAEGAVPSRDRMDEIARGIGIPLSMVYEFFAEYQHPIKASPEFQSVNDALKETVTEQILYLPTYRRIEQDLKAIFPGLDENPIRRHIARRSGEGGFIELVEFGMEDVEKNVATKMTQLKDNVRAGLNNLTTAYLRDVIAGEYRTLSAESIEPEELQAIESVFSRIEERTLPNTAKDRLRGIVAKIQMRQRVEEEEKVIALFLLKLLDLHRRQQAAEIYVLSFVALCNDYLVGKHFEYESDEFTIRVILDLDDNSTSDGDSRPKISLRDLSSGEKQIVSLFSHLLLSDVGEFFVLIDEPELSLSVPWQTRFLPDVISTGRCTGLVAVTHSPFIFENDLDAYGHNIAEFWE
jgi:ABC-type transport system involved in cytochrome c biogenesis ATPase subunit